MTRATKRLFIIILFTLAFAALTLFILMGGRDKAMHSGARFVMSDATGESAV